MGGAKGGSDFDPKGRSESEIRRFCQSFMTELYPYIGEFTDVPAGDIGVGEREIGYLFGQYKRIAKRFAGALTGKGIKWGGSRDPPGGHRLRRRLLRPRDARHARGRPRGQDAASISGSGNVAQFTGGEAARPGSPHITLSDSDGFVHDPDGIDREKLAWVKELKNERRGRIREYADAFPRGHLPSRRRRATRTRSGPCRPTVRSPAPPRTRSAQSDADNLVAERRHLVAEGANMPTVPEGVERFLAAGAPLRAEQGGQRRRGGGLGSRDGPGHAADPVVLRGGRPTSSRRSCGASTRPSGQTAEEYGRPGDYVARRQHRRVRQGGRRHARREPDLR